MVKNEILKNEILKKENKNYIFSLNCKKIDIINQYKEYYYDLKVGELVMFNSDIEHIINIRVK